MHALLQKEQWEIAETERVCENSLRERSTYVPREKSFEGADNQVSARGVRSPSRFLTFCDGSRDPSRKVSLQLGFAATRLHFAIYPSKNSLFWRFFILTTYISYSIRYSPYFVIKFKHPTLKVCLFFIFSLILVVFLILWDFFSFEEKLMF